MIELSLKTGTECFKSKKAESETQKVQKGKNKDEYSLKSLTKRWTSLSLPENTKNRRAQKLIFEVSASDPEFPKRKPA